MTLRTFELQFNILSSFSTDFSFRIIKTRLDCLSSRKTERVKKEAFILPARCKFNHDDVFGNLFPRVFSLFNAAAAYWKARRPWGQGCIFG